MVLAPAVKGAIILTPIVVAAGVALYESNEEFRGFCDNTYKKIHDFADEHGIQNPFRQQQYREKRGEPMAHGAENRQRREWIPLRRRRSHEDHEDSARLVNVTGVEMKRARRRGEDEHVNPLQLNPTKQTVFSAGIPLSIENIAAHDGVDASASWSRLRHADERQDDGSVSEFSTYGMPTPAGSEPSILDNQEQFDPTDTRSETTETLSMSKTLDGVSVLGSQAADSEGEGEGEGRVTASEKDDVSIASSGWSDIRSEISFESLGRGGRK